MTRTDSGRRALADLRARPTRTFTTLLGIAVGVAAVVAVLGVSQANTQALLGQLSSLQDLLTVTPGPFVGAIGPGGFGPGGTSPPAVKIGPGGFGDLPGYSLATVGRLEQVVSVSGSTQVLWTVRRNPYIPSEYTSPFPVTAVIGGLAQAVGAHVLFGRGLGPDDRLADAVLGYDAAQILGIGRQDVPSRLWVQDQWVVVTGVLAAVPSAPQLNFSVIVGYAFAQSELAVSGGFNTLYVRTQPGTESAVMKILPATVEPLSPKDVTVSQPSAAVAAEIDAKTALDSLFLALAAVGLLVAGLGVGNTLTIAVVERRPEIGLRRALGATRSDIGTQFLAEGVLLALGGAVVGVVVGTVGVEAYAWHAGVSLVLPVAGMGLGAAAALLVGSAAGLYPAVKAARLPPSDALRMAV